MTRTSWVIVITIIVLISLYIIYKYVFKNNVELKTIPANVLAPVIPRIRPIPSGVINAPIENNSNTDYSNVQKNLTTILKVLGYNATPDSNGNVANYEPTIEMLKRFSLRFPGTTDIAGNLIDIDKWKEYQPLIRVEYNIKDDEKANEYYVKLIEFWGAWFFNNSAQKITEAAKKSSTPLVDCNSTEYKNKLMALSALMKIAGQKYQIAVLNLNNYDNSENRQALDKTGKDFDSVSKQYSEYYSLCNEK